MSTFGVEHLLQKYYVISGVLNTRIESFIITQLIIVWQGSRYQGEFFSSMQLKISTIMTVFRVVVNLAASRSVGPN